MRGGISMDFVPIGNPGNAAHTFSHWSSNYSWGRVDYHYRIGTHEVTAGQWAQFLDKADLHTSPLHDRGSFDEPLAWDGPNKPRIQISWYHAAQFCNWLTSGNTRKGAYRFDSASGALTGIDRAAAKREYGQVYVLPTIDEWYKAAYFKPDGSGYSLYANGSSTPPAVYADSNYPGKTDLFNPVWDVGSGKMEQNGTYDIMGNLWEWIEEAKDGSFNSSNELMGLLGGSAHWVDKVRIGAGTGFIKTQPAGDPESWIGLRVVALGPHKPEVSVDMTDGFCVQFMSMLGTAYTIEESADMFAWSPAVEEIPGDGALKSFFFSGNAPSKYFRVQSTEL